MCWCILGWQRVAYYFWVTVTLPWTSVLILRISMSGAYLILFEVGIPNLQCACVLGWQSVADHSWVNVTSDLVSRIGIESCHCNLDLNLFPSFFNIHVLSLSHIIWGSNPKFAVCMHLGMESDSYHPLVTVTLTSDLISELALSLVHISYILWGRNSKFGVWMHLGMAKCHIPFAGQCDLDLVFRIIVSKNISYY